MALSTLLSTVQTFCKRTALPVPVAVTGSTDDQVIQIQALLEEGCDELAGRGSWEELNCEATWVTTATENQGAIDTLAPNGFRYLLPETLWDRTEKLPLLGPLNPQEWQALKAIVITGPRYSFRIRQDGFLVTPAPPAGHTWVFEYISQNWILALDGTTYKSAFTLDTDTILLPRIIVAADLRWRWKKEKRLDYAQDFDDCQRLVADALARDGGKPTVWMDNCGDNSILPGIFVPSGNWPV